MTFTEAALEVLRREGKPLYFKKIAEIAVRENLLDHVGKIPEETMADQLAAHSRLPRIERRLIAVQAGTFALAEWGLDEDPNGLEGMLESPPEDELPYRGRERHPIASTEMAHPSGRGEPARRRREEGEERRGKRFPPPAEVAYELLAGGGRPLTLVEIAAQGAERLLMPDAFVRDAGSLLAALDEDNRRRESSDRKALFQIEGNTVTLVAQPEPGERAAAPALPRAPANAAEMRKMALAALRRRLRECDAPTVEHVAARMLERMGLRELKVAKRGREHVVFTGRRKMGVADVRHCVRVLRNNGEASRRDVNDLRRELGHYGAQIGVVVSAGEAQRDARGEAGAAGQLPVVLLCGESFAEALADAGVGCLPVVVPEVDEAFFRAAAEAAAQEEAGRRARREERERREKRAPELESAPEVGQAAPPPGPVAGEGAEALAESAMGTELAADLDEEGEGEGEERSEGEGSGEGMEGQAGEGTIGGESRPEVRRRRRRRRRRGGRGRGREGEGVPAAAPGEGSARAEGSGPSEGSARDETPASPPVAPGGEGGTPS